MIARELISRAVADAGRRNVGAPAHAVPQSVTTTVPVAAAPAAAQGALRRDRYARPLCVRASTGLKPTNAGRTPQGAAARKVGPAGSYRATSTGMVA